jgi:hypothetical protein
MGILNNRKLKPKLAKLSKENAKKKEVWIKGIVTVLTRYNPTFTFLSAKYKRIDNGFYAGLNENKNKWKVILTIEKLQGILNTTVISVTKHRRFRPEWETQDVNDLNFAEYINFICEMLKICGHVG